jgi:uncharacterized protein YkwD
MKRFAPGALLLLSACGAGTAPGPEIAPAAPAGSPTAPDPQASAAPIEAPPDAKGPLTRAEAERFVLALVNRDRAAHRLPPVRWDETAAQAGRRHARDLAAHGVTSHVGTDGSVPEQRYTEAGGRGMTMENAGCFSDGTLRSPDPEARFVAESLARLEKAFMDEVPPHDGHRRNILTATHNAVGIGLAQLKEVDVPCLVEEFVDDYGTFDELPAKARPKEVIAVAGSVRAPVTVAGVGLARIELPRPKKPSELGPRGYPIPAPYQMFWPAGYVTPIVLDLDPTKRTFKIQVPLKAQPGLYEVSVWARFPEAKEPAMISLRTIEVR